MTYNTTRRQLIRTGAASALAAGIAGCSGQSNQSDQGDQGGQTTTQSGQNDQSSQYKRAIGGLQPLTGPLSIPGTSAKRGMEIAASEINGQLDTSVDVPYKDSAATVKTARSVVQSYISGDYPAVAGGISSDVCLALRDLAEKNEIPLNVTAGGDVKLTSSGTNWTFRYPNPSSAQEQMSAVEFLANETDVSNVALIMADYAFGRNSAKYFKKYAEENGISVESESFIPLGTKNFIPELNTINNDAIDAINIVYPGGNAISLFEQLHESGLFQDNTIISIATVTAKEYIDALGEKLVGMYVIGPDPTTEEFQSLDETLQSEYDTTANVFHTTGHDSLALPLKAIQNADSLDRTAIRDSMRNEDYKGVYGTPLEFNSNGLNVAFQETVTQYQKVDGSVSWHNKVYKTDALNPPV